MSKNHRKLRDTLLELVPGDGTSVGNARLRQLLGEKLGQEVAEADYASVRDALVQEGALAKGQGRGGSVRRAAAGEKPRAAAATDFVLESPPPKESNGAKATAKKAGKPAAPRGSQSDEAQVVSYRHADRRKNNPEVGMVSPDTDPDQPKTKWAYDPHLDPALQFDIGRAQVEKVIDDALASGDEEVMRRALEQLKRQSDPYLAWAGKAERTTFAVDTVSLHVHERIDPASILNAVRKRLRGDKTASPKVQLGLFAAPFENLPLRDAIDFYKHDKGWSNRLIAGDSLLVMNSLLKKEGMAGQVQMVFIDPPYGIKYGSNFQPFTNRRDVKDRKDEDLTQEPETLKAFRDTWELGIHSYLAYLRDRLVLSKDLLSSSGSVFVQISDENVHLVRALLDEVFGPENFCSEIVYRKTAAVSSPDAKVNVLATVSDIILWYARDRTHVKYRQVYLQKSLETDAAGVYVRCEDARGYRSRLSMEQREGGQVPDGLRVYRLDNTTSTGFSDSLSENFVLKGQVLDCGQNKHWKTTMAGLATLAKARRVEPSGSTLGYVRFIDDFPVYPLVNMWLDTGTGSFTDEKVYVVQTGTKALERCLLMTTDPGDLVLDPTCGSGTSAFVAEKWGRRWITCDTSRVAVTLAKQRLMTAGFDYFELKYPLEGLKGGFIYRTVPHVTLKSIANNPEIGEIFERLHPAVIQALDELNNALRTTQPAPFLVPDGARKGKAVDFKLAASKTVDLPSGEKAPAGALLEWEVPFDFPADWAGGTRAAFDTFLAARQRMQSQMDSSIAARAEQEVLCDQPQASREKVRITGPFTVEAVPFPTVLALDEARAPDDADFAIARSGETSRQHQWRDELLRTGIRGKGGQMMRFATLEALPDTRYLHTTGTLADSGERVVVSFGPEHGALEQRQVEMAMREAEKLRPAAKFIVFCAFAFDPEAAKDIDEVKWPGTTLLKAQMNTDLLTEDLKKARSNNQSFWLMGQPDIDVRKRKDGRYEVEVNGFDYFDTVRGELISGGKGRIAVWLLDTDYDERSLFPRQVFFPMAGAKDGWHKLRKDIRAELDEDRLAEFHGTVSLPFEPGDNRKVAVKVVDDRGIESLKVIRLD